MKRLVVPFLLATLVLGGAANGKLKRLTDEERTAYEALKVWFADAKEEKAYLKLKTTDERNQWLKDKGYWDRFYQYDKPERDAIALGSVEPGWSIDKVYMAWGRPHQRRQLARPNVARSELLVYLLEVTDDGHVLIWEPGSKETHNAVDRYRYEVTVENDRVVEMEKKRGWDY